MLAGFDSFKLKLSIVEIYNEQVRDIRRPRTNGLKQPGLSPLTIDDWWKYTDTVKILSKEHAMDEIKKAYQQRIVRPTSMNEVSSRSHCIISVQIEQTFSYGGIMDKEGFQLRSRVNLVDLAGSERGRTRKWNVDCIEREEEAIHINKSLLVLNQVISNLSVGKSYVPFGESKLTRLLKTSLGGNAFTVLVVNLSPSAKDYGETLSSLEYAKRAKRIQNKFVQNAEDIVLKQVVDGHFLSDISQVDIDGDPLESTLGSGSDADAANFKLVLPTTSLASEELITAHCNELTTHEFEEPMKRVTSRQESDQQVSKKCQMRRPDWFIRICTINARYDSVHLHMNLKSLKHG